MRHTRSTHIDASFMYISTFYEGEYFFKHETTTTTWYDEMILQNGREKERFLVSLRNFNGDCFCYMIVTRKQNAKSKWTNQTGFEK